MSFENSLKKGEIGERIVKEIVKKMGYFVYSVENEGSHPFDFMMVHRDQFKVMILDIKTIPRRNKYKDNGLDLNDWNYYWEWKNKTGLDFFILFVDEMLEEVYGNELSKLKKRYYDSESGKVYPLIFRRDGYSNSGIVYLHLNSMKKIADITPEEAAEIRSFAQRSHSYEWLKNNQEKSDLDENPRVCKDE